MSSRFDRSFSATFSSLLKLGLIFLGVTVLLCSISFLTASTYVCLLYGGCLEESISVFVLFEQPALVIFLLFGVSLKYALTLVHLKKSFKSVSDSFLLYTFGVDIKFKFLFKCLYSALGNGCLVKLIIFPF